MAIQQFKSKSPRIDASCESGAVHKQKSIQELFADYDESFFQTEEIDWGKPQGNEVL
jgi:hypothetical protein